MVDPRNVGYPTHCPICGQESKALRKHMRWIHRALLGWDPIDKVWCYIYY